MSANNADRAERAKQTIEFYNGLIGEPGTHARTFASDILADLLHYVAASEDEEGLDLEGICATAQDNFDIEREE